MVYFVRSQGTGRAQKLSEVRHKRHSAYTAGKVNVNAGSQLINKSTIDDPKKRLLQHPARNLEICNRFCRVVLFSTSTTGERNNSTIFYLPIAARWKATVAIYVHISRQSLIQLKRTPLICPGGSRNTRKHCKVVFR
jgi:hypothetical protein